MEAIFALVAALVALIGLTSRPRSGASTHGPAWWMTTSAERPSSHKE